jgi:cysteine desulfurase
LATPRIYLDYNASAPLVPQAREAMLSALDRVGNPSSVHSEGRQLGVLIETAREAVAALVGAEPAEVIFTSGATEANVAVLAGGWDCALVPGSEHESVLAPVRVSGARHLEIPVDGHGIVDTGVIAAHVLRGADLGRAVIALQLANNETGVIQPVAEVAAFAREHGLHTHTDAVQAVGRVRVDFAALGAGSMALSAHKIGGPKGIGALVVRDGVQVAPLITGGGQERRRRAGTENVAAIAGFGAAALVAAGRLADAGRLAALRDRLEAAVLQATPNAVVFGMDALRLPNTSCIGVAGRAAEIAVIKLDIAGFAVSAGSACSSGKVGASHVLAAMGAAPDAARGAIRVSLGYETTNADVEAFMAAWRTLHAATPQSETGPGGRPSLAHTATGD